MSIITLLTDFGLQDEYVGVLKGVILGRNPDAAVVDICHDIDAQDIVAAAYTLKAAYSYFPEGTVHAAVVDPGVGTGRRILAAECDGHCFVAPDNGLLEPVLRDCASTTIHYLENETLFRHPVSHTFHGRDMIAPAAAHLAAGQPIRDVGPVVAIQEVQPLKNDAIKRINRRELEGRIISIDRFGNLITNIHADDLSAIGAKLGAVIVGDTRIRGLVNTYGQGDAGRPVALLSSRNTLEIAVKAGNAARKMNIDKGAVVRVVFES